MGERADRTGAGADEGLGLAQWSRRSWLEAGALGLMAGLIPTVRAQQKKNAPLTPEDRKAIAAVGGRTKKAGLAAFEESRTEHFLGVGDGQARYRVQALDLCESIGRDFLAHFRKRGFKLAYPAHRLCVVTLGGLDSYGAFIGEKPDPEDGGRYELDEKLLIIFDFRSGASKSADLRKNTFTLVHETIHLLCYNTGLLSAQKDTPDCISEGLATYGELWVPPRAPSAFGAVNNQRMYALAKEMNGGAPWIPISQLITDDAVFRKPETAQITYAESWALVHYLMESEDRLPKFRAYLADLPRLGDPQAMSREKYAELHLGSLRDLDIAVRRHAQRMAKKANLRVPAGLSRGPG
jgi:Protein of unknown function (DUF1570)